MIEIEAAILTNSSSVDFPGRTHYCGLHDGRMYRVILDQGLGKMYEGLFEDTQWMIELFNLGMVRTGLMGWSTAGSLILEHKRFHFQSMFHEWTWTQKKDLASMIIRIQQHLEKKNLYLSDPHVYNVSFDDGRPVYFDFGSIQPGPYPNREWIRNFWLGQNWMESWMARLDISYSELQDFLNHPQHATLDDQLRDISRLTQTCKTLEWSHYDKKTFNVAYPSTWEEKHFAVRDLMPRLPDVPKTVLDVGGNTGDLGRLMLSFGVPKVCCIDIDEAAVDHLYKATKTESLPITTAVMDITDLYGWHAIDFSPCSWDALYQPCRRFNAELVLCVAFIHHVCYYRDFRMATLAEILSNYSSKYLMIEWIPYDDRHLEDPVNRHGVDKSAYTEEEFIKAFTTYFPTVVATKPSTDQVRKMYLFSKEVV